MKMSEFSESIRKTIWGLIVYESDILTTAAQQRYKIVINRVIWYGVHTFFEIDPRLTKDNDRLESLEPISHRKVGECLTYSGAEQTVTKLKTELSSTSPPSLKSFAEIYLAKHLEQRISFEDALSQIKCWAVFPKIIDGTRAKDDPDYFLLPGDHIQVKRSQGYHHAAIYIGNKKVIQVSLK
jgi:hypothetical protein